MNILIVSSSDGIFLTMARCLGINGHKIYGFSIWKTSRYAHLSRFCKGSMEHPVSSKSHQSARQTLDKINEYCSEFKIELIVPAGLWGTYFVAKYRSHFKVSHKFPIPSPSQIEQLHNKWFFYLLLKDLNIPTPNTVLSQDIGSDYGKVTYPVMIKPISRGNSDGVHRFDSNQELERYLSDYDNLNQPLLVQDYFEGFDAIFGFLADKGDIVAWTLHRKTTDFLEFFPDPQLLTAARKIISHVNYHGVGNFDIRYDPSRSHFVIIECNPRFWASCGASKYFGVDFFKFGVNMADQNSFEIISQNAVTKNQYVPHPSSARFAKGFFTGKYKLRGMHLTDLAWQSLLDPLPVLAKWIFSPQNITDDDDTFMIENCDSISI